MQSMTGFSSAVSELGDRRWRWEAKSVNGRGLDLRFRIGEVAEIDEPTLRAAAGKALSRGSVTIFLREEGAGAATTLILNRAALETALQAAVDGETLASDRGLALARPSIADILALKGVLEPASGDSDDAAAKKALVAGFETLMAALVSSRAEEGARIAATLSALVDRIEALSGEASAAFEAQQADAPARLAEKVKAVLEGGEVDPDRLAQELALLAVKADVAEELDRLKAHIAAARDLIAAKGPVGRKLDFLTQEFNREVNTLCSKSGSAELTRIGLDLKVVVDQLREQAANVE